MTDSGAHPRPSRLAQAARLALGVLVVVAVLVFWPRVAVLVGSPEKSSRWVRVLLQWGPGLSERQEVSLLHKAAHKGYRDTVCLLLWHGVSVNARDAKGRTVLHQCAWGSDHALMLYLVDVGADVNARDSRGCTPLHVAVAVHDPELVSKLVAKGADPNAKGDLTTYASEWGFAEGYFSAHSLDFGWAALVRMVPEALEDVTPAHVAALGCPDAIYFLRSGGGDVEARNKIGWTPLHFAQWWHSGVFARDVLAYGGNPDARDLTGRTPLHWAALRGNVDAAAVLLSHNAEVNARDEGGKTSLGLALAEGRTEMAELLREHGATE